MSPRRTPLSARDENEPLRNALDRVFESLHLHPIEPLQGRRAFRYNPRRYHAAPNAAVLVRDGSGLLRWHWRGSAAQLPVDSTRRASRAGLIHGEIVHQYEFEKLDSNKVISGITDLDRRLTPHAWIQPNVLHGLRKMDHGRITGYVNNADELSGKNVFLIVHGTASNCGKIIGDIEQAPNGWDFLNALHQNYDCVLTFDHPTLSVSPMINAMTLAALLRPSGNKAPPKHLDIICHSRGGLVTRWLCEALAELQTMHRVIFVGAPLAGTSLAAPKNIAKGLDFVTNVIDVAKKVLDSISAGVVVGIFTAIAGVLLKALNFLVGIAATRPVPDLIVQLIPGLAAQQRVGNNAEIDCLRRYTGSAALTTANLSYSAVKSNFEPTDPGWNLLGYFSKPLQRGLNYAADYLFESENDLVVDTASMDSLSDNVLVKDVHDFGTNPTVLHTNYFVQEATIRFIRKTFAIA